MYKLVTGTEYCFKSTEIKRVSNNALTCMLMLACQKITICNYIYIYKYIVNVKIFDMAAVQKFK